MKNTKKVLHTSNVMEFFRLRVQKALFNQHIDASEMAEFYLVNLLDEYRESSTLFSLEGEGPVMQPLALILKEANESDLFKKRQQLKRLGDTALYVAGFFADYINKSLVNLDYYISMGGSAYCTLSDLYRQVAIKELYLELATKFAPLVDVLAEVAPWSSHLNNKRLIQLYSKWLENGDERLKEILEREGIDTNDEQHAINP